MRRTSTATLVYDGRCGFCTRSAEFLAWLDRWKRLEIVPWQEPGTLARAGLTREEVCSAAWLVFRGRRYRGAGAVNAALSLATGLPVFSWLYSLPGLRELEDAVYAWVAANRSSLPGVKPYCSRPGADCGEG